MVKLGYKFVSWVVDDHPRRPKSQPIVFVTSRAFCPFPFCTINAETVVVGTLY